MEKKVLILLIAIGVVIVIILVNLVVFKLTGGTLGDIVGSPVEGNCITLVENSGEDKVDIVFLTENLDLNQVDSYVEYFLDSEPFNQHPEKFNFFYSEYGAECEILQDIAVYCYSRSLVKNSAVCPNDYIVVLADRPKKIRSSAYLNLVSVNVNHDKKVLLHEFAHVFANMADEYVPSKIPRGAENCVSDCSDFEDYDIEAGCFEGCSKSGYFRSSENSIMRTLKSNSYGELNLIILNEYLNEYE
jgi:hypothetical protein